MQTFTSNPIASLVHLRCARDAKYLILLLIQPDGQVEGMACPHKLELIPTWDTKVLTLSIATPPAFAQKEHCEQTELGRPTFVLLQKPRRSPMTF